MEYLALFAQHIKQGELLGRGGIGKGRDWKGEGLGRGGIGKGRDWEGEGRETQFYMPNSNH